MIMSVTKSKLRKLICDSLKSISDRERQIQSDLVARQLFNHHKYKQARNISLYLSTMNEIDTVQILKRALELDGKQCFIPYIPKSSDLQQKNLMESQKIKPRMSMVEIKTMSQHESLPLNKYGIKEPIQAESQHFREALADELDLIIVPGVAFSLDGRRLGHGMGYYDEFLASQSSNTTRRPYCIGLALREQIVDETLAQEGHDYVLDEVLVAET